MNLRDLLNRSRHALALLAALGLCSCDPIGSAGAPNGASDSGGEAGSSGVAVEQLVVGSASDGACGLQGRFTHQTRDGAYAVLHAPGLLAFRSPYAVNTDGAPNSYHPDDPWGTRGLAINTICNGATAVTASGEEVNYRQCERLVRLFEQARDAGWPDRGTRMDFYGIATETSEGPGRFRPCIQSSGPQAGGLVSTTSLLANPTLGRCDQRRYLNALNTPFIIVPGSRAFADRGMSTGDLAVVHEPRSGRTVFAVVGDRGPATGLGEGSVGLTAALAGRDDMPTTRRDTYRFGLRDAVTIVLADESMRAPYTAERISLAGREAFERFGGTERLSACTAELAR